MNDGVQNSGHESDKRDEELLALARLTIRRHQRDLLFVDSNGGEWHVVDATKVDAQMTVFTPGSDDAACRIFKPVVGPSLVYLFRDDDDRAVTSELLESQLARAAILDSWTDGSSPTVV